MKKKLLIVFVPLLAALVVHLAAAYSQWDINPANWSPMARQGVSGVIAVVIIMGWILMALVVDMGPNNKD